MTTTNLGTDSARHTLKAVDPQYGTGSPAGAESPDQRSEAMPAVSAKVVLFLVGCALLVGCAFAIDKLGQWSADFGQVWVFLGFFLVMSLGGRWFWSGADAVSAGLKTGSAARCVRYLLCVGGESR